MTDDVVRLRRAVVVTLRRMQEHRAGACPRAGMNGPCPWYAREEERLRALWRELRELGVSNPEDIRT